MYGNALANAQCPEYKSFISNPAFACSSVNPIPYHYNALVYSLLTTQSPDVVDQTQLCAVRVACAESTKQTKSIALFGLCRPNNQNVWDLIPRSLYLKDPNDHPPRLIAANLLTFSPKNIPSIFALQFLLNSGASDFLKGMASLNFLNMVCGYNEQASFHCKNVSAYLNWLIPTTNKGGFSGTNSWIDTTLKTVLTLVHNVLHDDSRLKNGLKVFGPIDNKPLINSFFTTNIVPNEDPVGPAPTAECVFDPYETSHLVERYMAYATITWTPMAEERYREHLYNLNLEHRKRKATDAASASDQGAAPEPDPGTIKKETHPLVEHPIMLYINKVLNEEERDFLIEQAAKLVASIIIGETKHTEMVRFQTDWESSEISQGAMSVWNDLTLFETKEGGAVALQSMLLLWRHINDSIRNIQEMSGQHRLGLTLGVMHTNPGDVLLRCTSILKQRNWTKVVYQHFSSVNHQAMNDNFLTETWTSWLISMSYAAMGKILSNANENVQCGGNWMARNAFLIPPKVAMGQSHAVLVRVHEIWLVGAITKLPSKNEILTRNKMLSDKETVQVLAKYDILSHTWPLQGIFNGPDTVTEIVSDSGKMYTAVWGTVMGVRVNLEWMETTRVIFLCERRATEYKSPTVKEVMKMHLWIKSSEQLLAMFHEHPDAGTLKQFVDTLSFTLLAHARKDGGGPFNLKDLMSPDANVDVGAVIQGILDNFEDLFKGVISADAWEQMGAHILGETEKKPFRMAMVYLGLRGYTQADIVLEHFARFVGTLTPWLVLHPKEDGTCSFRPRKSFMHKQSVIITTETNRGDTQIPADSGMMGAIAWELPRVE